MLESMDTVADIMREEEEKNSTEHSHFTVNLGELTSENNEQFVRLRDALRQIGGVKVAELINVENGVAVDVFTNRPLFFNVMASKIVKDMNG